MEPILELPGKIRLRGEQDHMAWLRKNDFKLPWPPNMCTTSFDEIPASITLGSEDIHPQATTIFWGRIEGFNGTIQGLSHFWPQLSMHTNSTWGISLACHGAFGGSASRLPYALDTHIPWQSEEVNYRGGGSGVFRRVQCLYLRAGMGVELSPAFGDLYTSKITWICGLKKRK